MTGPPDAEMRSGAVGSGTAKSHSSSFSLSPPSNTLSPPDLQELVLAHGGWNNIPPDAWADFDARLEAWRASIRDGVRWQRPARGGEQSNNQFDNSNTGAPVSDVLRGE
jgi:hypothetical protein